MNWTLWWHRLIGAFISGGAGAASTALSVIVVDPNDFNLSAGLTKVLSVCFVTFLISGIAGAFLYLKDNPVPWDGSTDRRGNGR